ncbi:hypothetical protein EMELA_v1c06850 [Mesoplasma melaleucae]|uniref:Lipoprotein n=2 Tax=Mesoplasma melaleucae TaxID=81459 RepID=A0A2K8NWH3_9MOLU|nr:hypothetical protein EMELA_v1c06850 [Mesoplasma melaleucae]
MKKLIAILGAVGLIATGSSAVVSCEKTQILMEQVKQLKHLI